MKVLQVAVSGSSGLVGSDLCARLRSAGHAVRPLQRVSRSKPASQTSLSPDDIAWDPAHGLVDPQQLESIDCVVHLAGRSIASARWTPEEKRRIRDSRVQPTSVLANQIAQLSHPPRVFVSASAIGIYGDHGDEVVDESTPAGQDFLAVVANDWEQSCAALTEAGVRVVHPRLGMVLSTSGGALAKMLPLFRWMLGGPLGSGRQYWSWVALQDVVSAIEWMLHTPEAVGPYNVVAPDPLTNTQFTTALARVVGMPAILPAPAWGLRLALGEMADALLLSSCRVVPRRLQEQGFSFKYPELEPLLRSQLHRS